MKQMADNSFRFLSKQQPWNYTSAVSARMRRYSPPHVYQVTRRRRRKSGGGGGREGRRRD